MNHYFPQVSGRALPLGFVDLGLAPIDADLAAIADAEPEEAATEARVEKRHAELMHELGLTEEDNADESEELWGIIWDEEGGK